MNRVTSLLSPRENSSKTDSKPIFDKSWSWSESKNSSPVSRSYSAVLASELQMLNEPAITSDNNIYNASDIENFWPSTLDKESEKASQILYSFCKSGFHIDLDQFQEQSLYSTSSGPKPLMVIPLNIIQNAVGLAIFTASRAGLWVSGSGGSGVLVARNDDGKWNPPAGILLQTSWLSFAGGVDIYDCIIVFNDRKTLDGITGVRSTIGGDAHIPTGPLLEVGSCESEYFNSKTDQPMLTYLKSRGFHANVSLDGTVIIGRVEENKRFYGHRAGTTEILAGNFRHSSKEVSLLLETLKVVECVSDSNPQVLEQLAMHLSPGDSYTFPSRTSSFGIPEAEDPDPFGVLALERAGLEIRESGSRSRPSSTQFEYHPSPTSPIFARFHRRSIDTQISRSNRGSYISTKTRTSIDRGTQTISMATQTDESWTPNTSPTGNEHKGAIKETFQECEEINYEKITLGPLVNLKIYPKLNSNTVGSDSLRFDSSGNNTSLTTIMTEPKVNDEDDNDNSELEDEDEEEPVIFEAASAQATVLQSAKKAGGGLVHIPKRGPPPPVPARSASRGTIDTSTLNALRSQFEKADLCNPSRKSYDDKYLKYSQLMIPNYAAPLVL